MKNSIFTIMRKELARFFGDRRMVVSILLPGVLVYLMYSFMGSAMGDAFGVDEDYIPAIQAVRLPESVEALLGEADLPAAEASGAEAAKEAVAAQELDLLLVFPEGFDGAVAEYDIRSGQSAPNVEVYYNSASTNSTFVYRTVAALLDAYEAQMVNKFDVNAGDAVYDLATAEDTTGSFFAMLMPMLLMMFLYSGCAAVAPESIAGEKERGTIATMLITPIRRSDIALGKILALAVISTVSAASSTIGTVLSLPKMMGGVTDGLKTDIYSVQDYLLLAAVILSTVLVLVTLTSILSAFAKNLQVAQSYAMPVMLLSMGLGITGMFGGGASQELTAYCIPLYNCVQCMTGVFSFSTLPVGVGITVGVNFLVTLLGVFVLAKMFNSEKIIFAR